MSKLRPSSKQVSHISRQGQGKEIRPFELERVQGHWICIIDRSYLVKFRSDSTEMLSVKVKNIIFFAKTRNYDIFVAKIYDYALIDSFWGFPRFIDSPTSYATLPAKMKNFEKRPYGDAEFYQNGSVDHRRTPYDVSSAI